MKRTTFLNTLLALIIFARNSGFFLLRQWDILQRPRPHKFGKQER